MLGVKRNKYLLLSKFEGRTVSYKLLFFHFNLSQEVDELKYIERTRKFYRAAKHATKSSSAYFRIQTSIYQTIAAHVCSTWEWEYLGIINYHYRAQSCDQYICKGD